METVMSWLLKFRKVYVVAVVVTLANSLIALALGVYHAYLGLVQLGELFFKGKESLPDLNMFESLDYFLVSFVFLIFSVGLTSIFLQNTETVSKAPGWLRITSLKDLKVLMWETVLVTMVVYALTSTIREGNQLKPDLLIIPIIVLVLSLGLWLIRKSD
jgi:uncharacterized membrane protein YqhA